ncbi:response regulator [Nocardioides marmoriginsengisoli]|nr:response regulator [Nocardioides marmoriginsengisoli]
MDSGSANEAGAGHWRVAVVEDHLLQRRGLVSVLRAQRGVRVVHEGESLPDLVGWLAAGSAASAPDLLALDLHVDRGLSVDPDVVRGLVRDGIKVLVVSEMTSLPLVRQVLRAGATGVVSKRDSIADVVAATRTVLGGGRWMTRELGEFLAREGDRPALSDQEERALVLYASGSTIDQVATALGVKRETAKTYVDRVKSKYAAAGRPLRTKVDLARTALADGYLD